jgi:hypothetical protein
MQDREWLVQLQDPMMNSKLKSSLTCKVKTLSERQTHKKELMFKGLGYHRLTLLSKISTLAIADSTKLTSMTTKTRSH